jgi:hypothetical protein
MILVFLAGGLMPARAAIIFKDNAYNYPRVQEAIAAAIRIAYDNDDAGYFRYLHDSEEDHLYVDVNNRIVGDSVAVLANNTMVFKTDAHRDMLMTITAVYHEAWHRIQGLRAPDIESILPPFYAVLLRMISEVGANWYDEYLYKKLNPGEDPIPTDQKAKNQRFNEYLIDFLQNRTDYLNYSVDSVAHNYEINEEEHSINLPAILHPEFSRYLQDERSLHNIIRAYLKVYLPGDVVLEKGVEEIIAIFKPVIARLDRSRASQHRVTIRALNNTLLALPGKIETLREDNPGKPMQAMMPLSKAGRKKLAGMVDLPDNGESLQLSLRELITKLASYPEG